VHKNEGYPAVSRGCAGGNLGAWPKVTCGIIHCTLINQSHEEQQMGKHEKNTVLTCQQKRLFSSLMNTKCWYSGPKQ